MRVPKKIMATFAGLGVLGALAAGVGISTQHVSAAGSAAVVRADGKISALQSGGFTLQNAQHTYTVGVGANTWIVVQKNGQTAQGALSDLTVGEKVFIAGTSNGTDSVDARIVTAGDVKGFAGRGTGQTARPGKAGHGTGALHELRRATVSGVNGTALTLSEGKGNRTVTVNTDAGTVVIKNGVAALADIKVGDKVKILSRPIVRPAGTAPAPGTTTPVAPVAVTAAVVYVPGTNDHFALGAVKTVTGNTVVLGGGKAGRTFTVGANTQFKSIAGAGQPVVAASLADVKVGVRVLFYGPKPSTGQAPTATLVVILLSGTAQK